MRNLIRVGALALALSALGCAQIGAAFDDAANSIAAGINSVTTALTSPAANQAAANLKAGAEAFVCAVALTSQVAGEIESGVGAGQSLIGTDGKVYTASADVCTALGGTVSGTGTVP